MKKLFFVMAVMAAFSCGQVDPDTHKPVGSLYGRTDGWYYDSSGNWQQIVNGAETGTYFSSTGSLTMASGTFSPADLTCTDDLTVGDDATITGDLTVTSSSTFKGFVTRTPSVYDTFAEGADKGLAILEYDGTAFDGTAGHLNYLYTSNGNVFAYFPIVGQTLPPAMTATGLNIGSDQTDNDGLEIYGGVLGASGRPFIIGTDPAFKFCATFNIQLTNGTDEFHVGFRRPETANATFDNYLDLASIGIVTVADPAAIKIETILNNGATTTTDTTDTWDDATSKAFCVLVSAAGVVTYTIDGAAPTVTAAFTFDDGDPVIPFVHFLQANAAQTGTLDILEWNVAYQ